MVRNPVLKIPEKKGKQRDENSADWRQIIKHIQDNAAARQILPQTETFFGNLTESNRNQIVFTIFRWIWNQTDVRLVPKPSENCKCILISV